MVSHGETVKKNKLVKLFQRISSAKIRGIALLYAKSMELVFGLLKSGWHKLQNLAVWVTGQNLCQESHI